MAIVLYLLVFSLYFNSTISYFFSGNLSHKSYVLAVAIIAGIMIIKSLISSKGRVSKRILRIWVSWSIILSLYYMTSLIYGIDNSLYTSFGRAMLIQVTPTIMICSLIKNDTYAIDNVKKLAPIVALVFTIVSFMAAFHPNSTAPGGYADTDYGLDYQAISYMASYASSLTMYYLMNWNEVGWFWVFKSKICKFFMSGTIIINILAMLISGGRGGVAVFGFLVIFMMWFYIKKNKISTNMLAKVIFIACFMCIAVFFSIRYVANVSISTSGFNRIVNAIMYGESSGRDLIHACAITIFKEKPFFGHGIGAVFYTLGNHAHSVFYDILIEAGIVGIIILFILIYIVSKKMFRLFKRNTTNTIWIIMFLDGFVMSLFSSYYLVQLPALGAIAYILAINI